MLADFPSTPVLHGQDRLSDVGWKSPSDSEIDSGLSVHIGPLSTQLKPQVEGRSANYCVTKHSGRTRTYAAGGKGFVT